MEEVILVDENDNQTGTEEKIKAHREGRLHRAFSIFIFNSEGLLLLQQRARSKYHCPGLWSNSVCSHPRLGETIEKAVHRRLKEELGFDCELKEAFSFICKIEFENGLSEHELDHVLIGGYNDDVHPDPEEVVDFKWVSMKQLSKDIKRNPSEYTYWLGKAIEKLEPPFRLP